MMRTIILLTFIAFVTSCNSNQKSFTPQQKSAVQDSVQKLTERIAKDISSDGPVAWLRYFENSPDFFMASDGQLVFPDNTAATNFINNILVRKISKIGLRWSNVRIDPLTPAFADIAANFHEDITDSSGNKTPTDGYFTAVAEQTSQGWKLRNVHWSIKPEHGKETQKPE